MEWYQIRDRESGKTENISIEEAEALEREFGINAKWLATGEGEMFLPGKGPGGRMYAENGPYVCFEEEGGDQGQKVINKEEFISGELDAVIEEIRQAWNEAKKFGAHPMIMGFLRSTLRNNIEPELEIMRQAEKARLTATKQDRPHQGG